MLTVGMPLFRVPSSFTWKQVENFSNCFVTIFLLKFTIAWYDDSQCGLLHTLPYIATMFILGQSFLKLSCVKLQVIVVNESTHELFNTVRGFQSTPVDLKGIMVKALVSSSVLSQMPQSCSRKFSCPFYQNLGHVFLHSSDTVEQNQSLG